MVSGPYGSPSANELIESVREWIERDVMPSGDGRLRFHARVAVNVLAMVERELELGPGHADRHAERLAGLGVASDRELADAIRAGDFDERSAELRTALRAAVDDKLAVANPKYLDR